MGFNLKGDAPVQVVSLDPLCPAAVSEPGQQPCKIKAPRSRTLPPLAYVLTVASSQSLKKTNQKARYGVSIRGLPSGEELCL